MIDLEAAKVSTARTMTKYPMIQNLFIPAPPSLKVKIQENGFRTQAQESPKKSDRAYDHVESMETVERSVVVFRDQADDERENKEEEHAEAAHGGIECGDTQLFKQKLEFRQLKRTDESVADCHAFEFEHCFQEFYPGSDAVGTEE